MAYFSLAPGDRQEAGAGGRSCTWKAIIRRSKVKDAGAGNAEMAMTERERSKVEEKKRNTAVGFKHDLIPSYCILLILIVVICKPHWARF